MLETDTALVEMLRADATLMALVDDQIYWYVADEHAVSPYLVLTATASTSNDYHGVDLQVGRYMVKAEGKVGYVVMQIADRVRQVLHKATLSAAGDTAVYRCQHVRTDRNVLVEDGQRYTQGIEVFDVRWTQ
ncbi:DUF3168 domain-containing protein [Phototrophicus methaneseepsis]|uniref:DUF3168 domain-containing protein n=1 Tax=Phototrophicus methaneseepsis TaxID=2710758 RepID=A0A7S8E820_9CHLR|nr:DUF3168 domain-containing protein [Phototrophicus methaneseepsis]QPC82113.1 DUF3168 domain-containing protein [Phototrophicus methaneseepsis]